MMDETRYRKANPVKLDCIIHALVEDLGIGPDIFLKKLTSRWQDIVGATNARNTKPVSLSDGLLTVAVSSPAWNAQARYLKPSFLMKIQEFEPHDVAEVRDIRFVLERS